MNTLLKVLKWIGLKLREGLIAIGEASAFEDFLDH
jgi:hypothetical protein